MKKLEKAKVDDSHLNLAMAHEPGSNVHRNLAAMPNLSPEAAKYLHKVNKPGSLVHQHLALNPITKSLGKSDDLEKSLTTPAHSAHGKLAAMLSKLRGTSLDKSDDEPDAASVHLSEIVQTLDDCLRTCTDEQAQEKISLAKDYLSALMSHLQYEPELHSALTDLMHNGPESKGV